jgi:hypothetical protein
MQNRFSRFNRYEKSQLWGKQRYAQYTGGLYFTRICTVLVLLYDKLFYWWYLREDSSWRAVFTGSCDEGECSLVCRWVWIPNDSFTVTMCFFTTITVWITDVTTCDGLSGPFIIFISTKKSPQTDPPLRLLAFDVCLRWMMMVRWMGFFPYISVAKPSTITCQPSGLSDKNDTHGIKPPTKSVNRPSYPIATTHQIRHIHNPK